MLATLKANTTSARTAARHLTAFVLFASGGIKWRTNGARDLSGRRRKLILKVTRQAQAGAQQGNRLGLPRTRRRQSNFVSTQIIESTSSSTPPPHHRANRS